MKVVLVHLSGSRRGETQKFDKEKILIGCDPRSDVRFRVGGDDKTSDRHAEIYFDNCEYYLRDLGSARGTFVNDHEVEEIILKDGDILELGEGGPKVRFHVEVAPGEVCKPFRTVYRDAKRKSRRFRKQGIRSAIGFFGEFSRGLLLDATPTVRYGFLGVVILLAVSILLSSVVLIQSSFSKRKLEKEIVQLRKQLTSDQGSRKDLERDIAEERKRNIEFRAQHQGETAAKLRALQEEESRLREQLQQAQSDASVKADELVALRTRLNQTSRQINTLRLDRSLGERIIKQFQGGVCYIEGGYRFYDAAGAPLRFLALDSAGEPIKDPHGMILYTTSGSGPIAQMNYTGTGFLVSSSGLILTNRHVAEPWWDEDETKHLAELGYTPRFVHFRAYFPGITAPFVLEVVKISQNADVALVKTNLSDQKIPVLEIERAQHAVASGQPVLLLGYPTGLDALLARLDEKAVDSIVASTGPDSQKIAQELSRRGMIRPLSTQGHLSDILPSKLIYDAQTTHGGSGGPLFNSRGKVIGINFAILSDFGGANFGVPIQFGLELMP